MENNEIMNEEAMEVAEDVVMDIPDSTNNRSLLKTSLIIGGIAIGSIFAYERIFKPLVVDKVKDAISRRRNDSVIDYEEPHDPEISEDYD